MDGFLKSARQSKWLAGLRHLVNVLVLLLAAAGLASVLAYAFGDGELPHFRPLRNQAPALYGKVRLNATRHLADTDAAITPETYWHGLQPSVGILQAISPPIAAWLRRLYADQRLKYQLLPLQKIIFPWPVYLSYDANGDVLNIGPDFWALPDGDKAAYIAHEYRHARQNRPKLIADLVSRVLSGQLRRYGSPLEDEAFLYQLDAYRAMDLPGYAIHGYLQRRNLVHFNPYLETPARYRQAQRNQAKDCFPD